MPDSPQDAAATTAGPSLTARVLPWMQTVLLNVVAPVVTYSVLTGNGIGEVPALLLSGVWPALELLVAVRARGRIDEFSVIVLAFLLVGTAVALLLDDPRLLLVKESAVTGVFGLALLASLMAPRPLMFYFGRRFATDGTADRIAWWNGLWQYPGFRRSQRLLTVVWGTCLLGEALLRIGLTLQLSTAAAVAVNTTLPYVVLALLIGGTVAYGKRAGARAAAARPTG